MLVKKEVFKKIGLFSEDYFLYYEDADFCVRARKNGFECMVIPNAKSTHFEKSESDLSNKLYWLVISGLIFFEKNTPKILKFWVRPYLHLRKVKNMLDSLNNKNKYAPIIKKAYTDFKIWKQNRKYPLVIVNYNSTHYIERCLSSLLLKSENIEKEIIIVSNDGSLLSVDSRIKILTSSQNSGFGSACNLGAKEAIGEYLCFLNPDT